MSGAADSLINGGGGGEEAYEIPIVVQQTQPFTHGPDGPPSNWPDVLAQMRSVSNTLRITCWIVVANSALSAAMFIYALNMYSFLTWERRVLLMTVVLVMLVGLYVMLLVSRNDPSNIIIFSMLTSVVAGFCTGQTICYT
jgi:hypothetical protein